MASMTARKRSKLSKGQLVPEGQRKARNPTHRIPVNPFIVETSATSREHTVLDLGISLIKDIVGTSNDGTGVSFQTHFLYTDRNKLDLNRDTMSEDSIKKGNPFMPPQELSLRMSERAFNACYRLHEVIPMAEFEVMVTTLYQVPPQEFGLDEYDAIALLFAVLALGFTLDTKSHFDMTCVTAIEESKAYSRISIDIMRRNLNQITSITQLRTLLSLIILFLFTEGPAAALELLDIACLATINLGLYKEFANCETFGDNENTPKQNTFWMVLYLDLVMCGLLAKPPFIDSYSSENATFAIVRHAARNVRECVRSPQGFLLTVGLALQIELFKIMRRISTARSKDDLEGLKYIKGELDDWEALFTSIFPQDEVVNVVARTRFELRMSHYLAVILLTGRDLRLSEESIAMKDPVTVLHIEYGKLCLETSVSMIDATIRYAQLPGSSPFSEPSAYILFLGILCLIAVSENLRDKTGIKNHVVRGVSLMLRIACVSHRGTALYLNSIQELSENRGLVEKGESLTLEGYKTLAGATTPHQLPDLSEGYFSLI